MNPRLIVTCGDVNGIGLECLLKAIDAGLPDVHIELAIDPETLHRYITQAHQHAIVADNTVSVGETTMPLRPIYTDAPVSPGTLTGAAGTLSIASLEVASELVLSGEADAVVTLPISKEACSLAGFAYPGQTEFFGERWSGSPLMVLQHNLVRVALATVHVPLRLVTQRLSIDHVSERVISLVRALTTDFGVARPSIAVLGVNPHAGENGTIGSEEQTVIIPAIEAARETLGDAASIEGPFAADGFFGFGSYHHYDGILAMYHDQGLIPLKLLARGAGVNVTSGLRFVRTSPDHGTAFGIAGQDVADPKSTIAAIRVAAEIVRNRRSLS